MEAVLKTPRRLVRPSVVVVLCLGLCGALGPPAGASGETPLPIPINFAPDLALTTADWPMFHNSADRLGVHANDESIDAATTANMSLKWEYPTGGPIYSSPAVSGGVVYFGSDDN